MNILRIAAGCSGIAAGIAGLAGHPIKAAIFGACAITLAGGWLWRMRAKARPE